MATLSICFLTGIIHFNLFPKSLKICFYYVLITFFVEWYGVYSLYISSEKKVATSVYSIYVPLSFLILSIFFVEIINNQTLKRIITILVPIIAPLTFYFMYYGNPTMINFKIYLIVNFLLCLYAISYFKEFLETQSEFYSNPYFWIVAGILFFNAGFFFLSGFINHISEKDTILARKLFRFNHLLNIIYYSFITYSFICQRRLAKS